LLAAPGGDHTDLRIGSTSSASRSAHTTIADGQAEYFDLAAQGGADGVTERSIR
jgi:hypothetical protein